MIDHCAVTTFSKAGYNLYGQRMLETFLKHWDIPIVVFTEDQDTKWKDPRILARSLGDDPERASFLASNPERRVSWHLDVRRFSHKVFALTAPRPECRWWIWIDADTLWHRDVTGDALAELCPEDVCVSFLGRSRCKYPQLRIPECGFVGYRVADVRVASLLDDIRHVYTSGEIHTLPQRHDSWVFWYCLKRSKIPEQEWYDMTPEVKHLDVWDHSPLLRYGSHQKGPARKKKVYGGVV